MDENREYLEEIEKLNKVIDYLLDAIEEEHLGMRAEMIEEINSKFNMEL